MRTRFRLATMLVALVMISAIFAMVAPGCTVAEARENVQSQKAKLERVVGVKQKLDQAIQTAIENQASADAALTLIKNALPPEWDRRLDQYMATGVSWIEATIEISNAIDGVIENATVALEDLEATLATKKASADATFDVGLAIASAVLGGGALAPIVGLVGAFMGRRRGAAEVAGVVNAGMLASPKLKSAIKEEAGDAHDVMRAELAKLPKSVRRAVRSVKI